ncbi:MAG: NAD-dependent protein deacylase [Chloroflexi bacterium RBG_16_51_16]|nr:MAG: NAD-dependent protein deacylase [Chloroflexi bacterium RBG_16_51_16]
MKFPNELISLLASVQWMAALTGAGASQESGLRTFRDGQSGLWSQYKPEELASPEAFQRNPKLIWDWYAWRREAIKGVRPNPGHYALVQISRKVPGFTLITQNVDGLHAMAGSPEVIELHGNIHRVRCVRGDGVAGDWEEGPDGIGLCPKCGGFLRPDVVWLGEELPRAYLAAAFEASRKCEVFLSIGTSSIVQPAAALPYAARNRGARIIEINVEPTPLTPKTDHFLQGKSGEILPELFAAVWNRQIRG